MAPTAKLVLVPVHGQQSGKPIVLPRAQLQRLLDGGLNFGCRDLIAPHPEAVAKMEVPNPHYVQSIDTPAAYDSWLQSSQWISGCALRSRWLGLAALARQLEVGSEHDLAARAHWRNISARGRTIMPPAEREAGPAPALGGS